MGQTMNHPGNKPLAERGHPCKTFIGPRDVHISIRTQLFVNLKRDVYISVRTQLFVNLKRDVYISVRTQLFVNLK